MFESLPNLPQTRRWRGQAYPVASVLAIIRRGEPTSRYLLIQRTAEPYIGKWALVGGRWEFGEALESAITREVKEETGLDATFLFLRGVVSERIAPLSSEDDGAHFLLFVCELSAPAGNAQEQTEGPVEWFSLEELTRLGARQEIITTDYTILQHLTGSSSRLTFAEAQVVAGGRNAGSDELIRWQVDPLGTRT